MTKKKKNIKADILQESLKLFNDKGVEYVGMREIAAHLSIKLGNITYYFPRKADLIYAHWQALVEANTKLINSTKIDTLDDVFTFLNAYFNNQYTYRCIILSFHHIIRQDERLWQKFKAVAQERKAAFPKMVEKLIENETIIQLNDEAIQMLNENITIITRYWLLQERVKSESFELASASKHYLKLIRGILYPYFTAKAKQTFKL